MTNMTQNPYRRTRETYRKAVNARIKMLNESFPERFWSGVDKRDSDGCWPWTRTVGNHGYGAIFKGKQLRTHRIAYELSNGKIPEGMCVLHKCDNRKCCNPSHLFLGTHLDNIADMVAKSRNNCGKLQPDRKRRVKLTEQIAKKIIQKYKTGKCLMTHLAKEYGMHPRTVNRIVRGQKWPHLQW